ncbi:MAG TPA: hypothetical protein VJS64_03335, partial [Pyrinomonadaceae bacterium]|nr:hypothetical protein [Pyrinomonadaceae bacterium]
MTQSFAKNITTGIRDGRFKMILKEYCLQWRNNPTPYVINNVIAHLTNSQDDYELFETLIDNDFRSLRIEGFGINAFNSDIRQGLNYFSNVRPNLLRYIRILFLDRHDKLNNNETLLIHKNYCKDFADFLQLDVPLHQRSNVGVHRILNRIFPLSLKNFPLSLNYIGEDREQLNDDFERDTIINIVSYELGNWRCKCGAIQGQLRRFDYTCKCGYYSGNGLLGKNITSCSYCDDLPTYISCHSCGTRVTLDLIWHIREGTLHPSEFKIPLTATLSIKFPSGDEKEVNPVIMYLPLMLGLWERNSSLVFELPDAFWVDSKDKLFGRDGSSGQ